MQAKEITEGAEYRIFAQYPMLDGVRNGRARLLQKNAGSHRGRSGHLVEYPDTRETALVASRYFAEPWTDEAQAESDRRAALDARFEAVGKKVAKAIGVEDVYCHRSTGPSGNFVSIPLEAAEKVLGLMPEKPVLDGDENPLALGDAVLIDDGNPEGEGREGLIVGFDGDIIIATVGGKFPIRAAGYECVKLGAEE